MMRILIFLILLTLSAPALAGIPLSPDYKANMAIGKVLARRLIQGRTFSPNDANKLATIETDAEYINTAEAVSQILSNAGVNTGANIEGLASTAWDVVGFTPWWRYAAILDVSVNAGKAALGWLFGDSNSLTGVGVGTDSSSGNPAFVVKNPAPALSYPKEDASTYSHESAAGLSQGYLHNMSGIINNGIPLYRDAAKCFPNMVCYYFPDLPSVTPFQRAVVDTGGDNTSGSTVEYGYIVAANWDDFVKFDTLYFANVATESPSGKSYTYRTFAASNYRIIYNGAGTSVKILYDLVTTNLCDPLYIYPKGVPNTCTTTVDTQNGLTSTWTLDRRYAAATFPNLATAEANMTPELLNTPVDPAWLANLIDAAWKRAAAQPGYKGMPYDATQPVTATEVQAWEQDEPQYTPTVADVLGPAKDAGSQQIPINVTLYTISNYYVSSQYAPVTNNTNTTKLDLGPDPGTDDPPLEDVPTGDSIANPITSFKDTIGSVSNPSHDCACPTYSFHALNRDFVMDAHCTLAESIRAAAGVVMTAVYAFIGFFWVLTA